MKKSIFVLLIPFLIIGCTGKRHVDMNKKKERYERVTGYSLEPTNINLSGTISVLNPVSDFTKTDHLVLNSKLSVDYTQMGSSSGEGVLWGLLRVNFATGKVEALKTNVTIGTVLERSQNHVKLSFDEYSDYAESDSVHTVPFLMEIKIAKDNNWTQVVALNGVEIARMTSDYLYTVNMGREKIVFTTDIVPFIAPVGFTKKSLPLEFNSEESKYFSYDQFILNSFEEKTFSFLSTIANIATFTSEEQTGWTSEQTFLNLQSNQTENVTVTLQKTVSEL